MLDFQWVRDVLLHPRQASDRTQPSDDIVEHWDREEFKFVEFFLQNNNKNCFCWNHHRSGALGQYSLWFSANISCRLLAISTLPLRQWTGSTARTRDWIAQPDLWAWNEKHFPVRSLQIYRSIIGVFYALYALIGVALNLFVVKRLRNLVSTYFPQPCAIPRCHLLVRR